MADKLSLNQFNKIGLAVFSVILVILLIKVANAVEVLQEYWSVFLIEDDDVSGGVAIYGNKIARKGSGFPGSHLVIIDLLDGSERHYGINEYVYGIDWIDMDGDWVATSHMFHPQHTVNAINLLTDEHVEVYPYPGFYVENYYPAIEGDNIVWMSYRPCCGTDLLHFDLDSRTTISITNDGALNTEYWPDVSGDWVVWNNGSSQNGDIHAYNMVTTEHVTVTQDAFAQWYPKIDGNLLTWTDERNGNRDIYGFDLETRQEMPLVIGPNSQYGQSIDGNLLTWLEYVGDPPYHYYSRDLGSGETAFIYESIPWAWPYSPTFLSGDVVIWVIAEEGNYTEPRLYGAKRLVYQSYLPIAAKTN